MAATVRVFIHTAVLTAPVSPGSGRFTTDAIMQLKQPYVSNETLSVDSGTAVTTSASLTDINQKQCLAYIQVQFGKAVHYEVTPSNDATVNEATTDSPIITGDSLIQIGPNYRISFLECTE